MKSCIREKVNRRHPRSRRDITKRQNRENFHTAYVPMIAVDIQNMTFFVIRIELAYGFGRVVVEVICCCQLSPVR